MNNESVLAVCAQLCGITGIYKSWCKQPKHVAVPSKWPIYQIRTVVSVVWHSTLIVSNTQPPKLSHILALSAVLVCTFSYCCVHFVQHYPIHFCSCRPSRYAAAHTFWHILTSQQSAHPALCVNVPSVPEILVKLMVCSLRNSTHILMLPVVQAHIRQAHTPPGTNWAGKWSVMTS